MTPTPYPSPQGEGSGWRFNQMIQIAGARSSQPGKIALPRLPTTLDQPSFAETMLSGSRTGSPRLILSTFSMPEVTSPQTVY